MSRERKQGDAPGRLELPAFDPKPSASFGCELLTEAQVPFALIGRVAMWILMPPDRQDFTKDVDFAIPLRCVEQVRAALAKRGIVPRDLAIGGLAVREAELRVDFIDRREGGLNSLYEEAIDEALASGPRARVGDAELPVVSPEYLVALNVAAAELPDQQDAVKLLSALPQIDLARTRAILTQHGGPVAANLLDALARQAGHPDARPAYRNSG
ncbi:MAG: hypothetical protein JXR96_19370 [Deltaproteobacteria bacterium]|nr:hypothetical protein [Deltaproteobacteria bacterium]